jgi:hypothetical protein
MKLTYSNLTNLPNKFILGLFVAGLLVGTAGAAYYVKKGGLQVDITSRAAHLQKAESDLEFFQTDLSRLQQSLEAQPQGQLTADETQIFRERINNEQAGIESELMKIVEDSEFLRRHWSTLTPQQQDLVDSAQKNRT